MFGEFLYFYNYSRSKHSTFVGNPVFLQILIRVQEALQCMLKLPREMALFLS